MQSPTDTHRDGFPGTHSPVMFGFPPNITGELYRNNDWGSSQFLADANLDELVATGALGIIDGPNEAISNGASFTGAIGFNIDASRSSNVYSGNKLQPSALQTLCYIKF